MTRTDKDEMIACVEEELLDVVERLEDPSHKVKIPEEWDALSQAAKDYYEALTEVL